MNRRLPNGIAGGVGAGDRQRSPATRSSDIEVRREKGGGISVMALMMTVTGFKSEGDSWRRRTGASFRVDINRRERFLAEQMAAAVPLSKAQPQAKIILYIIIFTPSLGLTPNNVV